MESFGLITPAPWKSPSEAPEILCVVLIVGAHPAGGASTAASGGDQILEVRIEGDAESLGVVEIAPEDIDKATLADVRVVNI